jgi:hypothetical protein
LVQAFEISISQAAAPDAAEFKTAAVKRATRRLERKARLL